MIEKVKILDFFIFLTFASVIFFSAMKVLKNHDGKKILTVQSGNEKFAYSLDEELQIEFDGLLGKSRIAISDGKAWFEDSPCGNKLCIEAGKIFRANEWAACLPNGIIICIEGENKKEELDAIAN